MTERRHAVSDVLDELSNEEIRKRIMIYGGPNLPVTEQTRGRLLEVLREYIEKSKQCSHPKASKSEESTAAKSTTRANDFNKQSSPARVSTSAAPLLNDDGDDYEDDGDYTEVEVLPYPVIFLGTIAFMLSFFIYYALLYDRTRIL